MASLWFYKLEERPLERVLPKLVEQTLAKGWRADVRASSTERAEALSYLLWTYQDTAFLPHGVEGHPAPEDHPVWLTTAATARDGVDALILTDQAAFPELEAGGLGRFARCSVVFNGADEEALAQARGFWKTAKAQDLAVQYWVAGAGGWRQEA